MNGRFRAGLLIGMLVVAGCETTDGTGPDARESDSYAADTTLVDSSLPDPGGAEIADPGMPDAEPSEVQSDTGSPDVPADPGTDEGLPSTATNFLIVAEDGLAEAAAEFAEYRQGTGYRVETLMVSDLSVSAGGNDRLVVPIRNRLKALRDALPADETLFLLLLGDAPAGDEPYTGRIPAVTCRNNTPGNTGCWTDNAYADLDGDALPDVAVGRVPARSNAQARAYLDKVRDHESRYETGLWNRRVSIYTGEADFSPEIDAMLEIAMFEGLKRVSHAYDLVGAYANPTSSYYYDPFDDKVVDLFNQGNLMVVYVGHGSTDGTQGLDSDQVVRISPEHRLPVTVFIACYAASYQDDEDSLAEVILWRQEGAVVAFGASDVSHPYPNAVLAYEIPRAALDEGHATAGEVMLRAKRQMVLNQDDEFRVFMSSAATIEVSVSEQTLLERQHLDLYNLIGDPATSMQLPRGWVELDPIVDRVRDGAMTVSGSVPGVDTGNAWVTLEVERDVIIHTLGSVDPKKPDPATVRANWAKANDKIVAGIEVPVVNGEFQARLEWDGIPPGGDFWVKVYAYDEDSDAIGVVWTN